MGKVGIANDAHSEAYWHLDTMKMTKRRAVTSVILLLSVEGDGVQWQLTHTVKEEPSGKLRYRLARLNGRTDLDDDDDVVVVFARSIIVINVADGHKSLVALSLTWPGSNGASVLLLMKVDGVAFAALVVAIKS